MILPPPGAAFEWRQTPFGPALVCVALEGIAPHLFTTRAWTLGHNSPPALGDGRAALLGDTVPRGLGDGRSSAPTGGGSEGREAAWAEVARALGTAPAGLFRMTQVHGRATVVADRCDPSAGGRPPEGDIALSSREDRVVAVQAADCVPLLIGDRRLGVVAAAHAGWRGLAARVPQAAVDSMVRLFGSRAEDLIAAIGPSVGACCYEVGPDVRQAFVSNGSTDAALAGWFTAQPAAVPGNPSMPGLPAEPQPGHSYFDGWACAREQLLESGLDHGRIHVTRLCTASHHDLLCSYRRDGAAAGRIAGAIRPLRRQTPEA